MKSGKDSKLLYIEDLHVYVEDKEVIRGVSLTIDEGEIHVIMGPNAAGKSSLLAAIAGIRKYRITKGRIIFMGKDITNIPPHERARLGISLAHQIPPAIKSVKVKDLVEVLISKYGGNYDEKLASILKIEKLMNRYLFYGFSGGERKRLELFLTTLQKPKLALLDEPDSGVDVDSLTSMALAISELVRRGSSVLLVTHTGYILEKLHQYCTIDYAHVMINGRIIISDLADKVVPIIVKYGYEGALRKFGVEL